MDGNDGRSSLVDAIVALQPRLRRFAYGLTGSREEADDLVQSAYERALSRLDQWRNGTRADSWMFRIMQTVWLNQLAANRVRRRHLREASAASLPDTVVRGDGLEARLTLDLVLQQVNGLPQEQKSVLLLVALEGFSYRETAEILDVPVGTVTSRLGRARRVLATRIEDACPVASDERAVRVT